MRSTRFAVVLSAAFISGVVCVGLLKMSDRAPAQAAPEPEQQAEPSEAPIVTAKPQYVLASTREKSDQRTTAPSAPAPPAPATLPESLDAVPMTPWREAQLARYTVGERAMLDYKLGLMAKMRECAANIQSSGTLNVFLHYETEPGTGVAKGSGVDPLDSTLDSEADAEAIECVRSAHVEGIMQLPEAHDEQREFHWATEIVFPLAKDRAYQFFAR
jgi:hypothetical protein